MTTPTYAGLSDVGSKRTRNDDRWGADPSLGLYIVADGVGSSTRGDLAAALVVEMLPSYVARHLGGVDLRDPQATARFGTAVQQMAEDLYARSRTDATIASADTTVVTAVVSNTHVAVAHLGDSRAYLYRGGRMEQLTRDHTIVQAVMDASELSAEEAAHFPNRSVLTRHVLMTPPAKPDVSIFELHPGDRILLCSDGLHGVIDDPTIGAILNDNRDPVEACKALTDAANRGGGPDNITAVVVDAQVASMPPPKGGATMAAPVGPTVADGQAPPIQATTQAPIPPTAHATSHAPRLRRRRPASPNLGATQQRSVSGPPPTLSGSPPLPPPPRGSVPPAAPISPAPPAKDGGGHRNLILGMAAATIAILLVTVGVTYFLWPKNASSPVSTAKPPQPTTAQAAQTPPTSASTSKTGTPRQLVVLPFSGLSHPTGVAVDSYRNVYVIDGDNERVLKLAPGSVDQFPLYVDGLKNPFGLAVDGQQLVYITDAQHGGRVLILDPWGGLGRPQTLPLGAAYESLSKPSGLAVDLKGNVLIADTGNNRIVSVSHGTPRQLPFKGLNQPRGVVLDGSGTVYVADQGNNRVVKLTNGSNDQIVLPFNDLDKPNGLAVDGAGNVYVTDSSNRIVELPAGATSQNVLSLSGLNHPEGVAVDSAGNVYFADKDNNRVLQLSAG